MDKCIKKVSRFEAKVKIKKIFEDFVAPIVKIMCYNSIKISQRKTTQLWGHRLK